MHRKSQTATEYLVILTVVIVIALVVVGVMGGIPGIGGGASENANLLLLQDQKVGIQNHAVSANGTTLFLKNNNAGLITVDTISINNSNYSMSITLRPGQIKEVSLAFNSSAEGQYRYPISLTYTESKTGASYTIYSDLYLIGTVSDTSGSFGGSGGLGGASLFETSSTDCYGEDSDSDSYYDICTCDDLKNISTGLSGNYELLYDIDFTECDSSYTTGLGWDPIDSFTGILHGRGNAIYNLYINRTSKYYVGLFGRYFSGQIHSVGVLSPYIHGNYYVSPLVGGTSTGALVNNSYSAGGDVFAVRYGGGLVSSFSAGTILNSYAANVVSGHASNCFAFNAGTSTGNVCDAEISGQTSTYSEGVSTASAQSYAAYLSHNWDFQNTWYLDETADYPRLYGEYTTSDIGSIFVGGDGSLGDPYQIENCYQLQRMDSYPSSNFLLMQNIDCSVLDEGQGFFPINSFSGVFDGGGNTISNLYINLPSTRYIGLFGESFSGEITSVGLLSANTTGSRTVGSLVGSASAGALINNSYSAGGVVTVTDRYGGGFVGHFVAGAIHNSYAANTVNGVNCFAHAIGSASGNYCDTSIVGFSGVSGATSATTAQMQNESTYTGWNFTTVWTTNGDTTYPEFQ